KVWSKKDYPRIKVGTMTLNRNPENHFAQIEQAAFSPGSTVPGIGLSPDRMLLARSFAYHDAARYRVGTNFAQLPVNAPKSEVHSYNFDGAMNYHHTGDRRTYAPNSFGDSWSDETGPVETSWESDGELVRVSQTLRSDDDDFGQAGLLVREVFDDAEREEFVKTVAGALDGVVEPVLSAALEYWKNVDAEIGSRIQDAVRAGKGDDIPGA
ncbi:MAG: catalase, partial [Micrococcus sp.]|nr:catalase [Micrococcus sp.]